MFEKRSQRLKYVIPYMVASCLREGAAGASFCSQEFLDTFFDKKVS
jgi:hypothetical protein